RSVSPITNAPKRSVATPTAVRQTPLMAIESPSPSCAASREAIVTRAPSPFRSTASTVPRSSTSPVNTSPLPQPRGDQQIVGDAPAVERQRADRVGDQLDALPLERVAGRLAAEQQRRKKQAHLVDLAGVEKRAGEVWAAFEQDRSDPERAEL